MPSYQYFGYISTQHVYLIVDYFSYFFPSTIYTVIHESISVSSPSAELYGCTHGYYIIVFLRHSQSSGMAQRKRIGPITQGSVDRNYLPLHYCYATAHHIGRFTDNSNKRTKHRAICYMSPLRGEP